MVPEHKLAQGTQTVRYYVLYLTLGKTKLKLENWKLLLRLAYFDLALVNVNQTLQC